MLVAGSADASTLPPIQPVPRVDLPRFMGTWYMIAAIPTAFERDAWDAVQTYTLQTDGTILTTLSFRKGAADGPTKHIHATAYVRPDSDGAVWGVQVFWPVRTQYIVAWLKADYSQMIVARDARDYVWVFSRTPKVPTADWEQLQAQIAALGYDLSRLRKTNGMSPAAMPREARTNPQRPRIDAADDPSGQEATGGPERSTDRAKTAGASILPAIATTPTAQRP